MKVQLAEQCKTAKKTAKTRLLELYEVASSQGMTPSQPWHAHHIRMCDGDVSHHEPGHASSRVSEENQVEDDTNTRRRALSSYHDGITLFK